MHSDDFYIKNQHLLLNNDRFSFLMLFEIDIKYVTYRENTLFFYLLLFIQVYYYVCANKCVGFFLI